MTYTERTWQAFVDKVVYLYEKNLDSTEIAKRLDTSEAIVEKVIEEYNLDNEE
jgi:transposase